jgi:hypothetical protein
MKKVILLSFVAVVLINANFAKFKAKQISANTWTIKDSYQGKR